MKRNCIIVHGCPGAEEEFLSSEAQSFNKHWMPWLAQQLQAKGIPTQLPQMPDPWRKEYARYVETFKSCEVNEETILVGHSCGCAFLVRWLGEHRINVKKLILVAPWKIPSQGDDYSKAFYIYPIDPTIPERVGDILYFTSNNEDEEGKISLRMFHDVLGGTIIDLPNKGHYTLDDMGTEVFPELLEQVLAS